MLGAACIPWGVAQTDVGAGFNSSLASQARPLTVVLSLFLEEKNGYGLLHLLKQGYLDIAVTEDFQGDDSKPIDTFGAFT